MKTSHIILANSLVEMQSPRRFTLELPEAEGQTPSHIPIFMGKCSDYEAGVKKKRENKEKKVPSINGFSQVTEQCSKFWKGTNILRLVNIYRIQSSRWFTSTPRLRQKTSIKSNPKFTTNVSCYMPVCSTAFSYKTCSPNAKQIRLKNSQVFKFCGKLHTLNSGATCALFRDSSKLKQKSTSASASLSTKFCSSEKERLMI